MHTSNIGHGLYSVCTETMHNNSIIYTWKQFAFRALADAEGLQ